VDHAVRDWAAAVGREDPRVRRIGYFGSYARGNWGVGSDLDVVVILSDSDEAFERRALAFDTLPLPVPADLFVYTRDEWERMKRSGGLARTVSPDVVWVISTD
jgi:predicted nucleotidyltransferase